MKVSPLSLVFAMATCGGAAGPAYAECIGPSSACEAYAQVAYVFVGTTLEIESLEPKVDALTLSDLATRRVRMRVDRSFKGVEHLVGEVIEFDEYPHETWIDPKPGERYLVFTNRTNSAVLDMCLNTAQVKASYDLELIERIAEGRRPPALTGVFRSWADDYTPISNVRFRLQKGNFGIVGTSSEQGSFAIESLKSGPYVLSFSHPEFDPKMDLDERLIPVTERGCGFLSIELLPRNQVNGRLLDAERKPIADGYVVIDGVGDKWGEYPPSRGEHAGNNGHFTFHGLPAGEYQVSVPWVRSVSYRGSRGLTAEQAADQTTAYYPGTLLNEEAKSVMVPRLGKVDLGDFRIPEIQ